ncbi:protein-disulfide reductase DsbD family protein [Maridesulfovibrio bastinii]|uniref:protein-disulfide reductase DsbD family protein n=1 Tax=Maridesulfovibrio bastinii TaxID=47157 RepID=UPI0003FAA7C3|nr:cytochrome c biogenesis protein CcdA [Maridesulfovibrio bastinii]
MRFKPNIFILSSLILIILCVCPNQAESSVNQKHNFEASWQLFKINSEDRQHFNIKAKIIAAMFIKPDNGWYTYTNNPGKLGQPTRVKARLNPGDTKISPVFLPGEKKDDPFNPGEKINVYKKRTPILFVLPDTKNTFSIKADLNLLMCSPTACLPVKTSLTFIGVDVKINELESAENQPWWSSVSNALKSSAKAYPSTKIGIKSSKDKPQTSPKSENSGTLKTEKRQNEFTDFSPRFFSPDLEVNDLGIAILFGIIAGFLLNFMPCVLPVISLKLSVLISGVANTDFSSSKKIFRTHNLFFSLGILIYFGCLSLILGATGMAWGQIFQKPSVVIALTGIVFALSLSLFGIFNLPVVDLKFGANNTGARRQAFFTGFLATLLATPCSGPFLGGVLGWAMIQPPLVISSVFFSVGLGMALPYIFMAAFPALVKKFPRPGAWTGWVEKAAGFFLAGTCIYLISILPGNMVLPCLIFLWLAGVGAWIWGLSSKTDSHPGRNVLRVIALCIFIGGAYWAATPPVNSANWIPFEKKDFTERLGNEKMLVEFTADWCPSCKVLEKTVLTPSNLNKWKEEYGITFIKVDLTSPDKEADDFLRAMGSRSIPLAAVFNTGDQKKSPLVLRDLYTTGQLAEALESLNQ